MQANDAREQCEREPSLSCNGVSKIEELPAQARADRASLPAVSSEEITRIVARSRSTWRVYFREMVRYGDLFFFLVLRDIRVRYSQTVLGFGWSVLQPLLQMVVFSVFFGALAGISSGDVPYPVFSIAAVVPWTYFNNAVTAGASSLITNAQLVSKVYFPRLFIPLSSAAAGLVDHAIALVLLGCVMAVYGVVPPFPEVLFLPVLIALLVVTTSAISIWLSALGGRYRDVRYITPFVLQLLLFITPVIYVVSTIPARLRPLYALHPIVGIVSGFRAVLLDAGSIPWGTLAVSTAATVCMLVGSLWYFRRVERALADIA